MDYRNVKIIQFAGKVYRWVLWFTSKKIRSQSCTV